MNELIDLDHGWEFIEAWITRILERLPETHVSPEEYMILYTAIYNMCERPHDYSQQMYNRYRNTFREYITSTVLPSLREKDDEFLLREFVNRWANHKVMMWWLSSVFRYLNQHFIPLWNLPGLDEVGLTCYQDLVCQQLKVKVRDAVISLIDQEREGEQIDQALLKNVLNVFEETGMGQMDQYEEAMLRDTEDYYSRKASNWILDDSCPDYMLKAEECLRVEKDRVSHYLSLSNKPKLLEKVQYELLSVLATQLLGEEHSGCRALLRDGKVEDFSRMCRLFFKIPKDLD